MTYAIATKTTDEKYSKKDVNKNIKKCGIISYQSHKRIRMIQQDIKTFNHTVRLDPIPKQSHLNIILNV